MIRPFITALALTLTIPVVAHAQTRAPSIHATRVDHGPDGLDTMSYPTFLTRMGDANLTLLAGRADVAAADARIDIARVLPSWELSGGITSVDVSGHDAATMTMVQLGVPIDVSDRVGARTREATALAEQQRAELEAAAWELRGRAAEGWIAALQASLILARRLETLARLEALVAANETRLAAGSIGEVPVLQSQIEARRYRGEVLSAGGEAEATRLSLLALLGDGEGEPASIPAFAPVGDLLLPTRDVDVESLVEVAYRSRPDIRALTLAAAAAGRTRARVEAERWFDLSAAVNWQHSFANLGSLFNQPEYDALGVIVAVELPVRDFWHGDLDAADAAIDARDADLRRARLEIATGVRAVVARYTAARARLELYRGAILDDADRVVEAVTYTWNRGGGSILEVLVAQRTADDLYLDYLAALAEHARQLVAIERATGEPAVLF